MKPKEQQDIVRALVSDYFDKYGIEYLPYKLMQFEKEHIIEIGTSILCTKWKIGYPGGNFAQAVVDNYLREAFDRADDVNQHCIKFYLMLMYNVGAPASLFK
jgi:hypothetical protein